MTIHDQSSGPLSERVLRRIESEGLEPRPRWVYLAKSYGFWALGALAVVLGALAFSAALFEVENAGWSMFAVTHGDLLSFFFAAAPFLWVAVLTLFLLLGYVNIRKTKRGYRYPLAVIALGAVLTSLTLGTALYATGFGGELEEALGDHPPLYRPILTEKRVWWVAPEKGLLAGTVVKAEPGAFTFTLHDFSGQSWEVDGGEVSRKGLSVVARGGMVFIVGTPIAATSSTFHACFVFPWHTYGLSDDTVAPPVTTLSSTSERTAAAVRTDECKGIRPYDWLRRISGESF